MFEPFFARRRAAKPSAHTERYGPGKREAEYTDREPSFKIDVIPRSEEATIASIHGGSRPDQQAPAQSSGEWNQKPPLLSHASRSIFGGQQRVEPLQRSAATVLR